jgi:serine/threonine-protein kinase
MGSVWVADHLALHTHVVVKFIAQDLVNNPEALARFSREAAAASQVKSPHVVQTLDHGVTEAGQPYIVMELLEGRDLASYLEAFGRMSPGEVANVVTQLARALDRAHARGIVHRDIKPENIFLCEMGNNEIFVKLLDFGIAKGVDIPKLGSATRTGTSIGTPFYMSPEQLLGDKNIDYRTDLWSVGVVAFEAITGKKPFDAETIGGIAIKAHSDPLPNPSTHRPELPAAVDAWFAHACARNPLERFASAKEMAEELATAVTGRMPLAEVVTPVPTAEASDQQARARTAHGSRLELRAATDAGLERSRARTGSRRGWLLLVAATSMTLAVVGFTVPKLLRNAKSTSISAAPNDTMIPPTIPTPNPTASAADAPWVAASSLPAPVAMDAATMSATRAGPARPSLPSTSHPSTSRPPRTGPATSSTQTATAATPPSAAATHSVTHPEGSGHDIF